MRRVLAALGPPLLVFRGPDGRSLPLPGAPPLTGRLLFGLFGALIAGVMSLLNTRLTTFGVADLRGGVGLDVDLGTWTTTAFSVGSIAIVPATPWLTDIFSPRRMFVASILLTTVSAVALGTVPTYPFIVLFRFSQGLGAGALLPLLLGAVLRFTPLQQRVWGIAMYAAITTLSPSVAELIDGWFTDYLSWKAIFWQNIVVAPIAIVPIMIGLPVEPMRLKVFRDTDYPAIIFCVVGVAALTAALSEGQTLNWFDSGVINGLFVIAAVSLAAFVVNELTCNRPLIDVRLFQQVNFTLGLIVLLTFNFTLLGAYLRTPPIRRRGERLARTADRPDPALAGPAADRAHALIRAAAALRRCAAAACLRIVHILGRRLHGDVHHERLVHRRLSAEPARAGLRIPLHHAAAGIDRHVVDHAGERRVGRCAVQHHPRAWRQLGHGCGGGRADSARACALGDDPVACPTG